MTGGKAKWLFFKRLICFSIYPVILPPQLKICEICQREIVFLFPAQTPRLKIHSSGSWSHLFCAVKPQPMGRPFIDLWPRGLQLGTTRPSGWALAASKNSPTLYAPRPRWHRCSLEEASWSERFITLLWVVVSIWPGLMIHKYSPQDKRQKAL